MRDFPLGFAKTEAFMIEAIALQLSVMLIVLSIGMSATWSEAMFVFRKPALLWRSILARNVLVPLAAILMLKLFAFPLAVAITIAVLAATPVPPIVPNFLLKEGGRRCYVFGLLVSQAALAIVIVPLTIRVMSASFSVNADISPAQVAKVVSITLLVPFVGGMAIRSFTGGMSRTSRIVEMAGAVLLVCAAIPLVFFAWSAFETLVGQGVLAGLGALIVFALAMGHLLGGPDEHDRTTLALATASAHPGVAIAIAKDNFPQDVKLVAGSVVIYLILRVVLMIPYIRWRRRSSIHGGDLQIPARA
jgi:BASS family bile acid:Na+ symporter